MGVKPPPRPSIILRGMPREPRPRPLAPGFAEIFAGVLDALGDAWDLIKNIRYMDPEHNLSYEEPEYDYLGHPVIEKYQGVQGIIGPTCIPVEGGMGFTGSIDMVGASGSIRIPPSVGT